MESLQTFSIDLNTKHRYGKFVNVRLLDKVGRRLDYALGVEGHETQQQISS